VQKFLGVARQYLDAAKTEVLGPHVRFTAAAEAAHTLLMAAMLEQGYKTTKEKGHRWVLFDYASAIVGVSTAEAAFLRSMHELRNSSIYDAAAPATDADLAELIRLGEQIDLRLRAPKPTAPAAGPEMKGP
jgi:hypothetical protein